MAWLGNNSWLIQFDDALIATDIDLASPYRLQQSPIGAEELAPYLDVHFITHGHSDHFNEKMIRVFHEKGNCRFVLPDNCYEEALTWGIGEDRITVAKPNMPFSINGMDVQPLRALHGDKGFAVAEFANFADCGYAFNIKGTRILQPGDSVLLAQHLALKNIDVMFVSPTEHNMHIQHSEVLIRQLRFYLNIMVRMR